MVKIKVEKVLDHLEYDLRKALDETLKEHFPDQNYHVREVYKTFVKRAYYKTNTWEKIPPNAVEIDGKKL